MQKRKYRPPSDDPTDCPTAWFSVLERARREGDDARAAEAQNELLRLGVVVRFPRRADTGECGVSRG